jgi:hypothetical protein
MYRVLLLSGLLLCLWAVSTGRKSARQTDIFIPVVVTEQLQPNNGVIPVDLRCGTARLSTPNRLEEFHCSLKNNTHLNITAANAIYSIVLENNGSISRDTVSSVVEARVHKDFRGTNKLIRPNDESTVGPPGPIFYPNGVIRSIEIAIDYVEFENGTSLGPDRQGSRIIRAMRAGAEKYKQWLKLRYRQTGDLDRTMSSEIETNQMLPKELEFSNPNEQQGAIAYRSRFRSLYQERGAAEVKKLLDSN